ncbi:futalosine hydrolase [Sphingobacterium alkalisoli]|uniref:Futalosine hydrolase n=1 Tax=Sphingobacterium alkalisoli TaxID=1874115 RepID=A0A4U0H7Y4_9SPHI|nr:futalosine hydrolase [Sphingobacterium alkalisoli]TJY67957.1 futalosine hydrolase [Sphingobacterium alkalisoli]GGH10107.1 futalosine hydrolase [Sphingobacterium alkalisoli]
MTILIVAATKDEILPSIPLLEKRHIPYLITGVGMVATAYHLGKELVNKKYDLILHVGIAGAFGNSKSIGDVVYIYKDRIAELGAEDDQQFLSIEEMGFGTSSWTALIPPHIILDLPHAEAISVNTTHGNEKSILKLKSRFPEVELESMEGAAVYYVAAQEKIAAIQVRAISNYVEKRNKANWNIPLAVKNLNLWLQRFVEKQSATR